METIKALPLRSVRISADPIPARLAASPSPSLGMIGRARAMLDLSLTQGPLTFEDAIMPWLTMIQANISGDEKQGVEPCREFLDLLLQRQVAPTADLWQGQHDRQGGFIVNVLSFCGHGTFDGPVTSRLCDASATRCARFTPIPARSSMGNCRFSTRRKKLIQTTYYRKTRFFPVVRATLLLTNIDAALAALGFDYDSDAGRDAACYIAWLTSSVARQNAGPVPLPPSSCPLPDLPQSVSRSAMKSTM